MSKLDRQKLPRVIAYCTASSYRMDDLFNHLQSRKAANGAAPKRFDEWYALLFIVTRLTKGESVSKVEISLNLHYLYLELGILTRSCLKRYEPAD